MNPVRSITLVIISMLFAFSSAMASESLLKHVQFTSQAMSALYMKGLSEGSEKYQRDLDRYKQKASVFLEKYLSEGGEQGDQLMRQWQGFSNVLKLDYSKDFGWEIDMVIRRNFRAYLSDIYQLVDKNKASYTSQREQILLANAQMEAISARFFDISSTYNGTVSLFTSDLEKLNPFIINKELKNTLDNLAQASENKSLRKSLQSAKFKWEFVEESVVNYSDQSAYFVVYATKNRIHQVLDKTLASIN